MVDRLNNLEAVIKVTTDSVNGMCTFEQVEKLGVDWDNKLRRDLDDMAASTQRPGS